MKRKYKCWIDYHDQGGLHVKEEPKIIHAESPHHAMYEFHKSRGVELDTFEEFKKSPCTGWGMFCELHYL